MNNFIFMRASAGLALPATLLVTASANAMMPCGEVKYSASKIAPVCAFRLDDGSWILSYSLVSSVRTSNGIGYPSMAKLDCKSKDYHVFRNVIKAGTLAPEYKSEVQSLLASFCTYVSSGKITKEGFFER